MECIPAFIPELNYVMEEEGKLVGQNMFMRTMIVCDDGRTVPVLTMGPIGITPELKRKGYGKTILDYTLKKAKEMGFGAVLFDWYFAIYTCFTKRCKLYEQPTYCCLSQRS